MTRDWKQWEGQIVNGTFPLRQYVGGSEHSAVFLTERRGREPQRAAIKLIASDPIYHRGTAFSLGSDCKAVSSSFAPAFRDRNLPTR